MILKEERIKCENSLFCDVFAFDDKLRGGFPVSKIEE